jgi:hypothetical protein
MLENLPFAIRKHIQQQGECWLWAGRKNRNGYGRVCWQGKEPVVHRLVYTLLVGPIPHGFLLDHLRDKCQHRHCCNPGHLEPVTPHENTMRGQAVLFKKKETSKLIKIAVFAPGVWHYACKEHTKT